MNVLLDFQAFSIQRFGGISRYFAECIKHMTENVSLGATPKLSVYKTVNEYVAEASTHPAFQGIKITAQGNEIKLYRANKLYSIYKQFTGRYDLLHPTYYDPYFLRFAGSRPFVLTFYDMIHERFATHYPEVFGVNPLMQQKKLLAQKASRLIAISEATKLDVVEMLKVPAEKVDVVHLATSLDPTVQTPIEGLPEHYILFVGNRSNYKFFADYLVSVVGVFRAYPWLYFVAGGSSRFSVQEQQLIHQLGLDGRVIHVAFCNDAELVTLYQHALAFVFPSLYEGFGIPLLEAFSCHCPAISSNQGSLPEVGGDAAAYFNPYIKGEAAIVLEEIVTNSMLRKTLVAKGLKRAAEFSWAKTSAAQVTTYKRALA